MKITLLLLQTIFIVAVAPLLSGIICKLKNNFRLRQGPNIFQPYCKLSKLLAKEEVVSETTSWIFKITPTILLVSVLTVSLLVPVFSAVSGAAYIGDFLLIIFILAAGRFFLALAGLDAGSAFGGMGSSREMFISSLAEPAALLAIFAVSLNVGSSSLQVLSSNSSLHLSTLAAAVALFIVTIAETSRIPIDNQETHLELTMVHEAMVLEYSGRSLALIELSSSIKQMVFFTMLANAVLPLGLPQVLNLSVLFGGFVIYLAKLMIISVIVAVLEVMVAKMRLFRVVDLLVFSTLLAVMAVVVSVLGW